MKVRKSSSGISQERAKEIYGVLFLAVAVFLLLCLFSYDAFDPSFTTLAIGRKVHNTGGVVGAHLADLLFTFVGLAAYLIPFALMAISFTYFAGRNLSDFRFGWKPTLSYLSLIFAIALLVHLRLREVELGGRMADAGGIFGLWLGKKLTRLIGRTGSYILSISLLLLAFISITRFSLVKLTQLVKAIGLVLFRRAAQSSQTFFSIAWARSKKGLQKYFAQWRASWQRPHSPKVIHPTLPPKISKSVPAAVIPMGGIGEENRDSPPNLEPKHPALPVQGGSSTEPKILPRVDLKENKRRDQLELISPMIAHYQLPQLSFLDSESQETARIDEDSLKLNSKLLETKLLDYDVAGRITEIHPGPIITMYEFEPAPGVKVNKIVNLEDDLALTMGGKSVRIIAPLPGKAAVGIEIPNNERETVWLKDVIGHHKFQKADSKLTLAVGKDTEGIPYVYDLAKMPHLLVAGATGSGKSVSVNSMILSLLYKATPEDVRLVLIDLKMLELSIYEGIPHLLLPVVTSPKKAALALRWAVSEMERRYEILSQRSSRNILGYNKSVAKEDRLPYIVLIIDELADLMMTAGKEVEVSITRLAQMARAAGIHLILATQRPSVDVITGLIKANFPARISFKVSSKHDSRTIIDTVGSEHLLGSGDMLFMTGATSKLLRVHGAYVSETEILRVVNHWKKQGSPQYLDEAVLKPLEEAEEKAAAGGGGEDFSDELYDQAVVLVTESRQASISMVQRRLRIGYNSAARMIERMEKEGVVGPADGAKPREVYAGNLTQN